MRRRPLPRSRHGFTLVEVLATIVLLGIVLPVAMRGVSVALRSASTARHTAEAATLGENKLNELLVSGEWSVLSGSGDFGQDWPGYKWTCQSASLEFGTEIVLEVTWTERGQEQSLVLATIASGLAQATSGTGG